MRRASSSPTVQLFPFLAVLVCAMGALILLLLITTRKMRQVAVARALAQQVQVDVSRKSLMKSLPLSGSILDSTEENNQRSDPLEVDSAAKLIDDETQTGPAMASVLNSGQSSSLSTRLPGHDQTQSDVEQAREHREIELAEEQLAAERLAKQKMAEELRAQKQAKEAELLALREARRKENWLARRRQERRDAAWKQQLETVTQEQSTKRRELATATEQVNLLRESVDRTEENLRRLIQKQEQLKSEIGSTQTQQSSLQEQEQTLAQKIQTVEKELADLRKSRSEESSRFAIVPYDGASGTTRRPIFIECTGSGIRFRPEDELLEEADLKGFSEGFNPLLNGCRALMAYWKKHPEQDGKGKSSDPYVLLLVRPNGTVSYYVARKMLSRLNIDFGYELIENDLPISFPPVNPEAKLALQRSLAETLRERGEMLAATSATDQIVAKALNRGNERIEFGSLKDESLIEEVKERSPFEKNSVGKGKAFSITRSPIQPEGAPGRQSRSGVVRDRAVASADSESRDHLSETETRFQRETDSENDQRGNSRRSTTGQPSSNREGTQQDTPTKNAAQEGREEPLTDPFARRTTLGRNSNTASRGQSLAAHRNGPDASVSDNRTGATSTRGTTAQQPGGSKASSTGTRSVAKSESGFPVPLVTESVTRQSDVARRSVSSTTQETQPTSNAPNSDQPSSFLFDTFNRDTKADLTEASSQSLTAPTDTTALSIHEPGLGQRGIAKGTQRPKIIEIPQATSPARVFGTDESKQESSETNALTDSTSQSAGVSESGMLREGNRSRSVPPEPVGNSDDTITGTQSRRADRSASGPTNSRQSSVAEGDVPSRGSSISDADSTNQSITQGRSATSRGPATISDPFGRHPVAKRSSQDRSEVLRTFGEPPSSKWQRPSAKASVAEKRDVARRRWGGVTTGQIGFERQVRMQVQKDRILMGDKQLEVLLAPDLKQEELVETVLDGLDELSLTWGKPPSKFYWVPYLKFEVEPNAEGLYERLHGPLRDWGLFSDVEFQDQSGGSPDSKTLSKSQAKNNTSPRNSQAKKSKSQTVPVSPMSPSKQTNSTPESKRTFLDWLRGR